MSIKHPIINVASEAGYLRLGFRRRIFNCLSSSQYFLKKEHIKVSFLRLSVSKIYYLFYSQT